MRRTLALALFLLCSTACSRPSEDGSGATAAVDRDTLTRRQRDSITATLPLPQSRAVGQALGSADAAAARAERVETEQGGGDRP